ncbi:MAG: hypothetical protein WCK47_05720 [bacterium]
MVYPQEATRKRRRWGCACGCLFIFAGLIFASAALFYFLLRPFPPESRGRWMDVSADGFGVVRLNTDNEGAAALLNMAIRRLEQQQQTLPTSGSAAMAAGTGLLRHFAGNFIHPEILLFFQHDAASGEEKFFTVVQMRNYIASVISEMLLRASGQSPAEKTGPFLVFANPGLRDDKGGGIAVSRQSLIASADMSVLRQAINRDLKQQRGDTPDALDLYLGDLDAGMAQRTEDLTIILLNSENRLEALLRRFERATGQNGLTDQVIALLAAQKLNLSTVAAMRVSAALTSADKAKLDIIFYCRQPAAARAVADILKTVGAQFARALEPQKITARTDARTRGSDATLSAEFTGLKPWFQSLIGATPAPPPAERN